MYQLEHIKSKLVDAVSSQINGSLECVNAEELGEVVDMVKDLSEAIYYCTITEAMKDKTQQEQSGHYPTAHYYGDRMKNLPAYPEYPMMYADNMSGGNRNYTPMMYANDGSAQSMRESRNYTPMMYASNGGSSSYMYYSPEQMLPLGNPELEGRSPIARRRYMDGKKQNDKQAQMRELEQYAQDLTNDLIDMIKDASPEERQMLQQKVAMLAQKIK